VYLNKSGRPGRFSAGSLTSLVARESVFYVLSIFSVSSVLKLLTSFAPKISTQRTQRNARNYGSGFDIVMK
jgi:hypothetical protein